MRKFFKITLIVFVSIIFIVFFFGGGKEEAARAGMQTIENEVAKDAVVKYGIAKRGGNKMDTYVHAGMVKAAYLQAKDEVNYCIWDSIEKVDARAAGMPQ